MAAGEDVMTARCPPPLVLEAWLTGSVAGSEADSLRGHVAACPGCQAELDRLSDDPELRRWAADPPPPADTAFDAVLARLLATPSAAAALPERIGPYRVEAELGRGGMGVVYRALDEALARPVAVKVVRPDAVGPAARERFAREARAAASVRYDHVVSVYGVGETPDGAPYLAMEHLAGPTLADLIRTRQRLAAREAAAVAAQVADGLAAAHAAGLVHRDVKPGNILFDPATGRAKLADFGLARGDAVPSGLTAEGVVAGTPAYLSPEQARGAAALDGRCDVYGLGVTLYEALTGEVPFRGAAHLVLRQILEDEPRPPRQLNDAVPRDLETVVLQALAKEPGRRYPGAAEFAADLRRWLNGEPVRARPVGWPERAWRWCRRNPRVAVLTGLVAGLLLLLAAGSTVAAVLIAGAYNRAERDREAAVLAGQRAATSAAAAEADFALALKALDTLVGTVQKQMGTQPGLLPVRRRLLETAAEGLTNVVHGPADAPRTDRLVVGAHDRLGDVYFDLGRTADAGREFEAGLRRAEGWAARESDDPDSARAVANAHDKLGNMATYARDYAAAADHYRRAFDVRHRLADRRPDDRRARRELSISYHKLGDVSMSAGDATAARAHFAESLRLVEELPPDGDTAQRLIDLRFRHTRLSEACVVLGDLDAAERHGGAALDCARELARADPVAGRRETGTSLMRLGWVALHRFDPGAAVRYRREVVALWREAAAAEPNSAEAHRDLYVALAALGHALFVAGDATARDSVLESLHLIEAEVAADPDSLQKPIDLSIAYTHLIMIEDSAGRFAEAAGWAAKAVELYRKGEANPKAAHLNPKAWRERAEADRAAYAFAAEHGFDDAAAIDAQPPGVRLRLLRLRAMDKARRGQPDEAVAAAARLRAAAGAGADDAFAAARACARAGRVAEAVAALRDAVRYDPAAARDAPLYPEFVGLRDDPGFRDLVPKPTAR
jgi:tetratricopeptide (TPR) repeat protein